MSSSLNTREIKILLIRSKGKCAFPGCDKSLVEDGTGGDNPSVIGEIAHIVGEKREGPRGKFDISDEDRNSHRNLILLCRDHHKIVDDQPLTYSIPVLTEMKKLVELDIKTDNNIYGVKIDSYKSEVVHTTLLPISNIPAVVYKGPCDFDRGEEERVRQLIEYPKTKSELVPYVFNPGWIFTFHNLKSYSNPFRKIVDPNSAYPIDSTKMWHNPDENRIFVALLNNALRRYLFFHDALFDKDHKRFYFPTLVKDQERSIMYKSLAGRRVSRKVVWRPVKRSTGEKKNFWWHLAANLSFHNFGENNWCLSIRPERHLTSDGQIPLPPKLIGKKVTSLKARMYNDKYLSEINFWREFLSKGKPRIIFNFGIQSAVIEVKLIPVEMYWPGIFGDEKLIRFDRVEDDLFTIAEYYDSIEGDELADFYEEDEYGNEE